MKEQLDKRQVKKKKIQYEEETLMQRNLILKIQWDIEHMYVVISPYVREDV